VWPELIWHHKSALVMPPVTTYSRWANGEIWFAEIGVTLPTVGLQWTMAGLGEAERK
jgi:hypothetical protein